MKHPRIPPSLHSYVLELSIRGVKAESICNLLKTEHGIIISRAPVQKLIQRLKAERGVAVKKELQEEIGKTVIKDLEIIDQSIQLLYNEALESLQQAKATKQSKNEFRVLLESCLRFIDRKITYSGLTSSSPVQEAKEEMINEMKLLLESK